MAEFRMTGGCQCGAVRYALHEVPTNPHICHCRMCQKAFGSFFAPLVHVPIKSFELTRGELAIFMSSDTTERGFCGDCGTPLTYEYPGGVELAIGAFDEPERAAPTIQVNPANKLSFVDGLSALPFRDPVAEPGPEAFKATVVSHQHPDHDTTVWPLQEGHHG